MTYEVYEIHGNGYNPKIASGFATKADALAHVAGIASVMFTEEDGDNLDVITTGNRQFAIEAK